jgi:hypothetical protein
MIVARHGVPGLTGWKPVPGVWTFPESLGLGRRIFDGEWHLSRRDRLIVAWHEVPGKTSPRRNRPIGYGMIGRG